MAKWLKKVLAAETVMKILKEISPNDMKQFINHDGRFLINIDINAMRYVLMRLLTGFGHIGREDTKG